MGRKKINDPTIGVSINIQKSYLDHLKGLCYEMSARDKKRYTISFFVRETLLQAYPMPKSKQMDMFGGK